MKSIFTTLAILALGLAAGCHAQVPLPGANHAGCGLQCVSRGQRRRLCADQHRLDECFCATG